LIDAQAWGDWQALKNNGRRVLRIHLKRGAKMNGLAQTFNRALKK
jgi:hypothetical protein